MMEQASSASRDADDAAARNAVIESILSRMNGFLYRCQADQDFTAVYVSDSIYRLTGHPAADFIRSRKQTLASIIHPEDLPGVSKCVSDALQAKQPWIIDYRMLAAGGGEIWVNETGAGLFDAEDNLAYLEGITIAADDRKRIEALNRAVLSGVATSSRDIVDRTKNVFGILQQLRILAFNARIEAVHAGEKGVGFAIVSQEMKTLADAMESLASDINRRTQALRELLRNQ